MAERIEIVVVGAGQAGLAMSWHLSRIGREHLLLDRSPEPGGVWRNQRWDSFTLVTPNHSLRLPGFPYAGDDPHGYLPRDSVAEYVKSYAASFNAPVRYSTGVTSLTQYDEGPGFHVETTDSSIIANSVIVAAGTFHQPALPAYGSKLPADIVQLHSSQYRNPASLPPGGVLVVGSGQSGVQIVDDLKRAGRQVWLSVGGAKRIQRRYRGRDMFDWLEPMGFFGQTFAAAPEPKTRLEVSPQMTGYDNGRTINLHRFAREGVRLVGRIEGASDGILAIAPGLHQNLRNADNFSAFVNGNVDRFIDRLGLDAPRDPEDLEPPLTDGFALPEQAVLDPAAERISSIIWSGGYRTDWKWLHLPVIDDGGYPIQERGVTAIPGLYFVGQHWLHTRASGLFSGVGADAEYLSSMILR